MTRAHDEIIDFIAGGCTPEEVIAFQASDATKARVEDLIDKEKSSVLRPEETAELNQYMELEHIMRMAKARARARRLNG